MGSVLILKPSNLGLGMRLAYEGTVVKVLSELNGLNGDNPRRIGSLRMLDQYDFVLTSDLYEQGKPEAKVLGDSTLHGKLQDREYLTAVVENLCDAEMFQGFEEEMEELVISTWFDGSEFLYNGYYVDYKRLVEGNRGPTTDGMGYVLWKAGPADELLSTFQGIGKLLKDLGYTGPLTLEVSLTEEKVYIRGMRACFDTRHLLWHELAPKGLYNMFLSLSVETKPIHLLDDYVIGVSCITLADQAEYRPDFKIDSGAEKHFYSGIGTARGNTVQEVRRRVYRTVKNVCSEDREIMFRSDIGAGVEAKIGQIKRWGWMHA